MKVLNQTDYLKLFIGALQYDEVGLIAEYFKGVFNEHKECNPWQLFNDGIEKANKRFTNTLKKEYNEYLREYRESCSFDPENIADYEEPNIYDLSIPLKIDGQMICEYSLKEIEFIKDGYDFIAKKNELENEIKSLVEKLKFNPTNKGETSTEQKANKPTFTPETINLKNWIEFKKITLFTEIEKGLFEKGFIDANYKWLKKKRKLIEFLKVINEYQFFREKVLAHIKQPFHYRQFISERYGYNKTGLTATSKEYKPTFETSKSSFFWIDKPI